LLPTGWLFGNAVPQTNMSKRATFLAILLVVTGAVGFAPLRMAFRRAKAVLNVQQSFQQGRRAIGEGNYLAATDAFRTVLSEAPDYEPMWTRNNLAYALDQLHRYDEAAKLYHEALELPLLAQHGNLYGNATANAILYRNAAANALSRDDAGESIRIATLGTARFPKEPWLWEQLGWAYGQAGQTTRANQYFDAATALAFKGDVAPRHETPLSLPFRGAWLVIEGNGGAATHRGLQNHFAWDFMAMDATGQASSGDGSRNEYYYGFGKEICAPADGKVIESVDLFPDQGPREKLRQHPEGNRIVLQHRTQEFTLFYHLEQFSAVVKAGDVVKRGEVIARCGNSGSQNSVPHLHFSLMDGNGAGAMARPARFSNYLVHAGGRMTPVAVGCPTDGQIIQPAE
jgi:murein DD-endopeptidase MepM/ murein hydrolase activator NlpD